MPYFLLAIIVFTGLVNVWLFHQLGKHKNDSPIRVPVRIKDHYRQNEN